MDGQSSTKPAPLSCVQCDCVSNCGDDPWLKELRARKCEASISGEAARRAEAWQAFETWFNTAPRDNPHALAPARFMDRDSARCGWFAARGNYR